MNINQYLSEKKILIFDLDGVIVESDKANFLAYREAVYLIKNIDLYSKINPKKRFTKKTLLQILSLDQKEYNEIIKLKNILFKKYMNFLKVNCYIFTLIQLNFASKQIILATNANKKRATMILHYLGLSKYFHKKFFLEDYQGINKYLYILKKEKLQKEKILIFEDNERMIPKHLNIDYILIKGA